VAVEARKQARNLVRKADTDLCLPAQVTRGFRRCSEPLRDAREIARAAASEGEPRDRAGQIRCALESFAQRLAQGLVLDQHGNGVEARLYCMRIRQRCRETRGQLASAGARDRAVDGARSVVGDDDAPVVESDGPGRITHAAESENAGRRISRGLAHADAWRIGRRRVRDPNWDRVLASLAAGRFARTRCENGESSQHERAQSCPGCHADKSEFAARIVNAAVQRPLSLDVDASPTVPPPAQHRVPRSGTV